MMNEAPYAITIGGKRQFTDTTGAAINPATLPVVIVT